MGNSSPNKIYDDDDKILLMSGRYVKWSQYKKEKRILSIKSNIVRLIIVFANVVIYKKTNKISSLCKKCRECNSLLIFSVLGFQFISFSLFMLPQVCFIND